MADGHERSGGPRDEPWRDSGFDPDDDAIEAVDPLVGTVIAARYRVTGVLGAGGIGCVYRARQGALDRDVAIKVLHPHLVHSTRQKVRFRKEALAASRLGHPAAVVVHDFGEWDGRLFLVMEVIEGQTLARVLVDDWPLATERIVRILAPVCDVLDEAHRAGIVHRDVKPANIMVSRGDPSGEERVKLVDFGLVRLLPQPGESEPSATPAGFVTGTPAYMSPEQLLGEEAEPASDLYAVGIVLYQLLCGQLPFRAGSPAEFAVQHLYAQPPPPSSVRAGGVDARLESLALQALAKDPGDRPASAGAFAAALRAVVGPDPGAERPAEDSPRGRGQDRLARAAAAGIGPTDAATVTVSCQRRPTGATVVVCEPEGPFARTIAALLRANDLAVVEARTLADVGSRLAEDLPTAIVVDVRADPDAELESVARTLCRDGGPPVPLVVVGPDGLFDAMRRALELGAADYVAESVLSARLPARIARIAKRAAR